MSTEALGSAISGLRVAQRGLDLTANNVANASTPGYTRKTLPQEAVVAGDTGVGVRYGEVQRYVDQNLMRDYRVQLGQDAYLSTKEGYLARIIEAHGSTDAESNVAAQIGALYSSFVGLSSDPSSASQQQSVIAQAQKTATTFNNFFNNLQDLRNEVSKTLGGEVSDLNSSLQQIADLNKRIQVLDNTGRSSADLQDQRDNLVKKVSGQLDVSYYTDGDGTLVLQTKAGQVLVDTEARPIAYSADLLTASKVYPASASGVTIQDSATGGFDLATISPGGKIGALLEMRDKTIPSYTAQLDELAYTMMQRFNDQSVRLFTDSSGTIPINDPSVYTGISGAIRVNPAILTNPGFLQQGTSGPAVNAGSDIVVQRVINFTFGKYKDAAGTPNDPFDFTQLGYNRDISINVLSDPNATLQDFATSMIDVQAQDHDNVKATYDSENQYMQSVEKRLLDTSAVNTDEEMTTMIELQKAYGANAKMVNALDQLFQQLLNAI
jgi:flagellar hook-associated protein 1 FlgK